MFVALTLFRWVLCAQTALLMAAALTHHRSPKPAAEQHAAMVPSYDVFVFPIPSQPEPGTQPRLPTNEENAMTVVEDSQHEDVDNIGEVEQLIREPLPESEIAAERERLQETGELPPGELTVEPPSEDSNGTYYNDGVKETSEILGDTTSNVENDGQGPNEADDEKLKQELEDRLEQLGALSNEG
ncbi:hypothetical protein, conserved [Babesia bigemina]|uniref:Uncharacterized protein n=1 Tax=Babesia bigemina TaxID=5866 RepID=A0A061D2D5_BABBI|nr:hypothetical protein, conserved [Babesia bigemina]CDR94926.1 hypothetical protein, conserved [Babesia bigemina]|eukprot:XP_012767112.1 hypothetical protein, conserved [Babesia bigemina]